MRTASRADPHQTTRRSHPRSAPFPRQFGALDRRLVYQKAHLRHEHRGDRAGMRSSNASVIPKDSRSTPMNASANISTGV